MSYRVTNVFAQICNVNPQQIEKHINEHSRKTQDRLVSFALLDGGGTESATFIWEKNARMEEETNEEWDNG